MELDGLLYIEEDDLNLIKNKLGVDDLKSLDLDLIDSMEALEDYEEVENGAESCHRFKLSEDKWVFIDNYGFLSIEPSDSWYSYFFRWEDDTDISLMRFCLGNLIRYEEVDEDYEGEVRVFVKHNKMSGYNEDGWVVDDWGNIKIFDSLAEAKAEYKDDGVRETMHNQFDPTHYIFCKAD
jgi:hypothetical protein